MLDYLHPLVVHFPIALWMTALLFYFLYAWRNDDFFVRTGIWLHVLGVLGGVAALLTGERDEEMVEETLERIPAAHELIEQHETMGKVVTGLFAVLALWVLFRRPKGGMRWVLVAAMAAAAALLAYQGHIGGRLVYEFLIKPTVGGPDVDYD